MGHETEVSGCTDSLKEQWELLLEKIEEKTQKLREANQQQQFNEAVNDMDFWLGEVEAQLSSEDCGRDLAGVQNLLKKHQLVERDVLARQDRLGELSGQAKKFVQEQHFDAENIQEKHKSISDRYSRYGVYYTVSSLYSGPLNNVAKPSIEATSKCALHTQTLDWLD